MPPAAISLLIAFSLAVTFYFVLWNVLQMAMAPLASVYLWRHQKRYARAALALVDRLTKTPLVSIVVPARNEALTIVENVRALMAVEYEPCQLVVVNDGSTDDTLAVLTRAFHLVAAPLAFVQPLASAPLRGIYRSVSDPTLVVIDKENGGSKADAVNAGINAASGSLVVIIDADTVVEPDAVSRAVLPFLEDPHTIAVGANVAITNGCHIEDGRITEVALPPNWFARFQIIEYMRAFLLFRLASAALNGVVLISGAFGVFRRDAVIAVGGYDRTAIGEDMDLTVRLHRFYRERGEPFRIAFDPHPLAWTQAPEDWRSLRAQRRRWRRGLLQVLWRHRRMIGNPRFGVAGVVVLPYIAFFEGLGPLLEVSGYVMTTGAALFGVIHWQYCRVLILVSVLFGAAATLLAVLMSDIATRRYLRGPDFVRLVVVAIAENIGYRQLNSWWGCVGTLQALTGKGGWGVMQRRGFARVGSPQPDSRLP
jgi:cellulose synthase/poly-beta-1,6-N-acetylglucosamine synthase-like glycosyltransferase